MYLRIPEYLDFNLHNAKEKGRGEVVIVIGWLVGGDAHKPHV